ncbi:MAG: hypothetical protein KJ556_03750 [Gammaproteobacteria bacterium]|nr:hypothetical protein [Gammaproteobacteria bacterium]MBU2056515.1 hypothetical protein [Gammaproteobacteria bacterium]MBU2174222.1 hypothetical protein [Gammaproteobacteria bacterium]MBU2248727.1 hypothetical protein [Gammaproteobacteria bacterium]MBU2344635.1 hypothetical protein [Gammaproteobacteria bacterium]
MTTFVKSVTKATRMVGCALAFGMTFYSIADAATSDLAKELVERTQRDQQARSAGDFVHVEKIDRENSIFLRKLLDTDGWPRVSEVGEAGARAAWLLAQHADHDPELQKKILGVMYELAAIGEALPANAAFLHDRIHVAEGTLQRFGTQGDCEAPGKWAPKAMESKDLVDEYRSRVGLPPLSAYIDRASASLCAAR